MIIGNTNRFDDDESDEDNFLSFKNTKSTLFNDSELMKQTGWYYRIKGPVVSLFNVNTIHWYYCRSNFIRNTFLLQMD